MKILYYCAHPHINMAAPSGPGTHIREVINGLEKRGHTVIKLIAGGEKLSGDNVTIQFRKRQWKKWIPAYLWQSVKDHQLLRLDDSLYRELVKLIEREKPDVIYERSCYLMSSGFRASLFTKTPYFCEMNAPYPEEKLAMDGPSLYYQRGIKNERNQVKASKNTFVVSSAMKGYLGKKIPDISSKIIVTPNAVNPANKNDSAQREQELRTKYGFTQDEIIIGFVGSIFPYHGVDALINAVAILHTEGEKNIKCLIIGDGEILSDLKQMAKEAGLENVILFTGNIPHKEIYAHIGMMTIAVMARSNWYGSPVKIFEYGLMEKCIVAPDVIPVRDVMVHGKDGFLVKDNISSLTQALRYLLQHPAEANSMANHFHKQVMSTYTWQHICDTILQHMQ